MLLEDKGEGIRRSWERLRASWATVKFYFILSQPERKDSQKFFMVIFWTLGKVYLIEVSVIQEVTRKQGKLIQVL